MSDHNHLWDEEEAPAPPPRQTNTVVMVEGGENVDGRYAIYITSCPLCGGDCPVKKKNRSGFPMRLCKKHNKWIESFYKRV